jgi:hypothetical protein
MRPPIIDRKIAFSILIGLVVTTVSGMWINTSVVGELPDVQLVSEPLLGVSYWGFLFPWLKQVVYPGAVKSVIWQNFIADVFFWSIVGYIVLSVFKMPRKAIAKKPRKKVKKKASKKRRRR